MTDLANDLAALLTGIDRAGDFHTEGKVEIFAPGLEVEGVRHCARLRRSQRPRRIAL